MTEIERLRFYLRDSSEPFFFSDAELNELLESTGSFEEAIALGWLVRGSAAATQVETAGAVTAKTIGKISQTYGASGESSSSTAFAMARYWQAKAGISVGRWFEVQPASGFIAESIDIINALELHTELDTSRLMSIGW